jgi:hypothetical protein
VVLDVPLSILEKKEVDAFVKPHPLVSFVSADVPVFDRLERSHELTLNAGFLANLTDRSRFRSFPRLYEPFGQLPPVFGSDSHQSDLNGFLAAAAAINDATSGDLGYRLKSRARHTR